MARTRYIKPGLCCNETLGLGPVDIHFTFACLPMFADRAGRLEDRPNRLKVLIHPYRDVDMEAHLEWLHNNGFILRYTANNVKYIQVLAFERHQRPHKTEKPSEIPAPLNNGSITVKQPLSNGELTEQERPLVPYNLSTLEPLNEKGEPDFSLSDLQGQVPTANQTLRRLQAQLDESRKGKGRIALTWAKAIENHPDIQTKFFARIEAHGEQSVFNAVISDSEATGERSLAVMWPRIEKALDKAERAGETQPSYQLPKETLADLEEI